MAAKSTDGVMRAPDTTGPRNRSTDRVEDNLGMMRVKNPEEMTMDMRNGGSFLIRRRTSTIFNVPLNKTKDTYLNSNIWRSPRE